MKRMKVSSVFLMIALLYLFVPVIGTVLYAFSTDWYQTVLPEGLTFQWFAELFTRPDFLPALLRSLLICSVSTLLSLLVIVPTVYIVYIYAPALEKVLQAFVMLTYAVPGIILAIGLLRTYSSLGLPMLAVVIGVYAISLLPIVYQATRNSLLTLSAKELIEASALLGAGHFYTFKKVILPNIGSGVMVAGLLSFSMLFGEFTLINMLVGGQFQTMQMLLYGVVKKSGHVASALSATYFLVMAVITFLVVKITHRQSKV